MMFLGDCEILSVRQVADLTYRIRFSSPQVARTAQPGQFLLIRIEKTLEPFLRRPMSVHRVGREDGWVEILFKIVGKGTRILAEKKAGDRLDVMGPLGKGFDLSAKGKFLLIAGGMGIAPLLFAAQELLRAKRDFLFLVGFKNKGEICCVKELKNMGAELRIATEDGSVGCKGTVIDLLKDYSTSPNPQLLACGPRAMLRQLARICEKWGLDCQVSLEERMACGLGACMGCPVKTRGGYKLVCLDGPVFDLKEVLLDG